MPKLSERSEREDIWEGYDRPPAAEERLVTMYQHWRDRHKSEHIPDKPLDAARWWLTKQEPPVEGLERPEREHNKRGDFTGWRTPYHDRVAGNFRIFLSLSETEKAFIIHHVDQGIPWRGDPMPFYKNIIEQHFEMLKDPEAYKRLGEQIRKEVTNAGT